MLHAIGNCPAARGIWNLLVPTDQIVSFYSGNLQEWITSNLQNGHDLGFGEVYWKCFFGILIWRMWKITIFLCFKALTSCSNLPENWVYLNTDGFVRLEDGSASVG
ncbi:hypothetical protein PVK06_035080 [Gossypium arboreum]|uniref:Uncharacterized protein n=1 Tax=Gossypium arboreum TaxID=29729 RepID=A0ABR0NI66_GOSAR|nr:hypothetical protein PVK06_035080 [Gossypium arboreum]